MKIKEVLDKTAQFFREKKIDTARFDAEILISYGLSLKRIDLYLKFDQPLKEEELEKLRALVKRRSQGEPVAYIIGQKEFFGEMFKVSPAVLIPRPETEHIIEQVLDWTRKRSFDQPLRILDLGCGSGCIGLTLAKKIPHSLVTLVDYSQEAIAVARENSESLQVVDKIEFVETNADSDAWLENSDRRWKHSLFDIIVSNPPYIERADKEVDPSVHKYEPHMALYSDNQGLHALQTWSTLYSKYLSSEAIMVMEMGYTQAAVMYDHFKMLGQFNDVQVVQDLSQKDRVIFGAKSG